MINWLSELLKWYSIDWLIVLFVVIYIIWLIASSLTEIFKLHWWGLVFIDWNICVFCFLRFGSQSLTLSKIVPHICNLLGDPTSQVRPWTQPKRQTVDAKLSTLKFLLIKTHCSKPNDENLKIKNTVKCYYWCSSSIIGLWLPSAGQTGALQLCSDQ